MLDVLSYLVASLIDRWNGRDIGQGIPDYPNTPATEPLPMTDIPNNYPTLPGVTDKDRLQQATDKIEADLLRAGVLPMRPHPNADRQRQRFDTSRAAAILVEYVNGRAEAEWFAHEKDPEPWYSFAQWVAAEQLMFAGDTEVFVVDLTSCNLQEECGPNGGGHVIIEDHEMLVTLVLYAAPHATDGRALALYQVERLS